ncbi:MAG: hypothetical protein AAGA26_02925 [Pseudomonadota bacterium]
MAVSEILLITALSCAGAALGYGTWLIAGLFKRAKRTAEAAETSEQPPKPSPPPVEEVAATLEAATTPEIAPEPDAEPETSIEKQSEPLALEASTKMPASLERRIDDLEGLLREVAGGQAALLEAEPPVDPRVETLAAGLADLSTRFDSLDRDLERQFETLISHLRENQRENAAATTVEAPDTGDVVDKLVEGVTQRVADDLLPHLSLLGEDLRRVMESTARLTDPRSAVEILGARIEEATGKLTAAAEALAETVELLPEATPPVAKSGPFLGQDNDDAPAVGETPDHPAAPSADIFELELDPSTVEAGPTDAARGPSAADEPQVTETKTGDISVEGPDSPVDEPVHSDPGTGTEIAARREDPQVTVQATEAVDQESASIDDAEALDVVEPHQAKRRLAYIPPSRSNGEARGKVGTG